MKAKRQGHFGAQRNRNSMIWTEATNLWIGLGLFVSNDTDSEIVIKHSIYVK